MQIYTYLPDSLISAVHLAFLVAFLSFLPDMFRLCSPCLS